MTCPRKQFLAQPGLSRFVFVLVQAGALVRDGTCAERWWGRVWRRRFAQAIGTTNERTGQWRAAVDGVPVV